MKMFVHRQKYLLKMVLRAIIGKYVYNNKSFLFIYFILCSSSDDSLGYEFPFILKAVNSGGKACAWCPWYRFCRGCRIQCSEEEFNFSNIHLAIDWDPTALHLRYQTLHERVSFISLFILNRSFIGV